MSQWELSAQGQITPLHPLTPQLSCRTSTSGYERHASSVRGWQQAGSESDNRTYPCHMPRLKPTRVYAGQWLPPHHPSLLLYQPLWPWVGTDVWSTDVPTPEPLLEPQGSTKAGTQLQELLAKVSPHTQSHRSQAIVLRVIEVLRLNAGRFITLSDLMGRSLTAHMAPTWQVDKSLPHACPKATNQNWF